MAAAAGMSIEQVTAAAMVMAKSGIKASESGVALRSALVRMVRPTREMSATLARLNINLGDFVTGKTVTARDVVSGLAASAIDASAVESQIDRALKDPKLKGSLSKLMPRLVSIIGGANGTLDKTVLAEHLTDILTATGQKVDLIGFVKALQDKGVGIGEIARLFDVRQGGRLMTLKVGADALDALVRRLETEAKGSTDKAAATMQQGIVGAWNRFNASITKLWNAIAKSGVLDAATNMFNGLAGAIEKLGAANPALLQFGTYALLIAAAAPASRL
jgi:hypothetical protein